MPVKESTSDGPHSTGQRAASLDRLRHAIDHAAHLLPAQGPISVFIHHNTLHAFEHLPFDQGVRRGAEIFGCQPYLSKARYRAALEAGRIRFDDVKVVLHEEFGERGDDSLLGLGTRAEVRSAMLRHPVWSGPVAELLWLLTEAGALRRVRRGTSAEARGRLMTETRRWVMRDFRARKSGHAPAWADELLRRFGASRVESWDNDEWESFTLNVLWRVCKEGAGRVPPAPRSSKPAARPRDLLLEATSADADELVHDLLIRFCGACLDQGVSHWVLPDRDRGLYQSFLSLYRRPGGPPDAWLRQLPAEAARLQDSGVGALESIEQSLAALGIPQAEQDEFLSRTLLALRGWGGMVLQVAQRSDSVAVPIVADALIEFLAVRLVLDRLALAHVAREELGFTGPLASLRDDLARRRHEPPPLTAEQRAFPLFQLAQVMGWSPEELHRLTPGEWSLLLSETESFGEIERRYVFHLAYEKRFRDQSLDALILHHRCRKAPARPAGRPRFQIVACLDEREESFRRHLEEVAPDVETFGAAGFFGVAMYYKGATDAHFVPLCPIVVKPGHWVEEVVADEHQGTHRQRTRLRRLLGAATHRFHVGSRSLALGAALSAGLGALAAFPLVARTLFPRLASRISRLVGHPVHAPPATRLKLERTQPTPGPSLDGCGYAIEEMANVAERLLRDIGLISGFARLVFMLGHGSDSQNNPHKSAYDCGACGGSPGAPNGRALAQMLNDPRIRQRMAARGVVVPDDTWFVGGGHNTCDDSVTLYDLDDVPATHTDDVGRAMNDFAETCNRNAHERCRRFTSARLDQSPDEAHYHVEGRSEDLAQPRPELGHATNALCIVARRERTRGLYLDRRAFLTSYDPTQDDAEGSTLARLLGAAVPVCAGINLEYYFSHVDNQGYGCGSKLPHNVTALLGVMDGAASDLRTGLPWQMVEFHEPIRLLFVIESTPQTVLGIMDRNPVVGTTIRNGWVQLAILDPNSDEVLLYRDGQFHRHEPTATHLAEAGASADWYRGWRDHLEFASIG